MCQNEKKCQNCCEHKNLAYIKETNSVQCKDCDKAWNNYISQPIEIKYSVNPYPVVQQKQYVQQWYWDTWSYCYKPYFVEVN